MKRLIAFDLDGTLAESKQPLSDEVAAWLARLLAVADAAIISGGDWPQFEKQIASRLPPATRRDRLWLMPTTGTKLYRFAGGAWRPVYAELFDAGERAKILTAFDRALADAGLAGERIWGERIEDRGSQITFSGLGQQAPLAAKEAWDPDRAKRTALQAALRAALPELSINLGGTTSIDVTRKVVDKAYGLRRLSEESGVALEEMLFLGDAIYPGGNDYPAFTLGLDTVRVRDVAETVAVVTGIIACLGS
ncbi:MAG: HAD-IIB family hydrolase [Sphingomonas sp.]|uniref:HAD-IIB family hydrolase n=1 Tax=Sphingomonas sp. TaxID=28214 RepID=UPI002602D94D|nr:HAD-IIB family hydrolase [Sphingomonas sp.]MDK2770094.1 HAD-IIB family hydrolase [Sphingomonas sp.]